MYYIIENEQQFDSFAQRKFKKCFVEVIMNHDDIHPKLNQLCLVYLRPEDSKKGYIFPINHNEAFYLSIIKIRNLIASYEEVYVRDKKLTMYFLSPKNLKHIPLIYNIDKINELHFNAHSFFLQKYPQRNDINKIVPISKHYERCEEYFKIVEPSLKLEKPIYFDFYNIALESFKNIEYAGIKVNIGDILKYFPLIDTSHSIKEEIVYTRYNLDTTTKRPSNIFNGINFAALPKTECRQFLIPKNNKLIDIDIDSYHPTLIAKHIGYSFGEESIHDHFAKLYGVDYNESKEITFKQLYGGIYEEYKHIEFFSKTQQLIDNLWNQFNKDGFIECSISQYRFEKSKFKDMTPQKLFSYWVQNLETSQNLIIISEILRILKNYKSKLVLYTYDSFLLDMSKDESFLLENITNIFDKMNFKYKIKYGDNYWDLKKI